MDEDRIWNEAIESAAKVADEWSHKGDPAVAMYASPRIRDRILRLRRSAESDEAADEIEQLRKRIALLQAEINAAAKVRGI